MSTTPGGAEVYVDDVLRGTSDAIRGKILVDGLTAGLHSVRVLKEGFNEYKINVALEEGRQTDLQVAIPARATVAMPQAENTAAGGFDTIRLQGADEIKTAVLVVESLPTGTTLFVGSEPVAHAGEDGRATVSLRPGAHEIRATTPSGATATRVVSVTSQDTGALKTMTLPLTQATVTGGARAASRPERSRRGNNWPPLRSSFCCWHSPLQLTLFLRGPARAQIDPASNLASTGTAPAPAQEPCSPNQTGPQTDAQQASEDKKKAADARRQAEQEAAAIEAQKKAAEAKDKADKKETSPQQPALAVSTPQPAVPAPPPAADTMPDSRSTAPGRDGCVLVTVLDADGEPATGVKVGLMDESEGGGPSTRFGGFTGPKGHWQQCGLTPGHSVRVAAMGPRGGLLNSQTAIVAAPRTFITIHLQRRLDDAPQRMPDRKGPFRRKP